MLFSLLSNLESVINNTERGKKINQTVVQTGKAVGSALTNGRLI